MVVGDGGRWEFLSFSLVLPTPYLAVYLYMLGKLAVIRPKSLPHKGLGRTRPPPQFISLLFSSTYVK
jgi:hypothetical protein